MELELWNHPACPNQAVDRIDVCVDRPSATRVRLVYEVAGRVGDLLLPPRIPAQRANNLWRTTCFEAFLRPAGHISYLEFNFAPSTQWAAYNFAAYRDGMVQASLPAAPEIAVDIQPGRLRLEVDLSLDLPHEPYRLGLSAIIEERRGYKSCWALNHPSGGDASPDFHHHSCFDVDLPPAPQP